jgi:hypothetical protein
MVESRVWRLGRPNRRPHHATEDFNLMVELIVRSWSFWGRGPWVSQAHWGFPSILNKGNGASDPILLVPVPDTADDDDSKEGLGPGCLDGSVRKTCLVGQCSKRLDQNLLPQQV